jgi:nucleotide-binding universal stress UspA family protein
MNIKTMLLRLQSALGQANLSDQMLLHPGANALASKINKSYQTTNFVVAHNGSPNSQTALDFVFWMADQARLTLQQPVVVHVVYVLDSCNSLDFSCVAASSLSELRTQFSASPKLDKQPSGTQTCAVLNRVETKQRLKSPVKKSTSLTNSLEQADRILWQARCLADEWRGSLEAHLRFGSVPSELRQVVESVHADLLFVGCSSPSHPLLQQLKSDFPCPILGIPSELEAA